MEFTCPMVCTWISPKKVVNASLSISTEEKQEAIQLANEDTRAQESLEQKSVWSSSK